MPDALFHGKNLLDSVYQGLKDGYYRFADNLSGKLKDIFIPFCGILGGPGNPPDDTYNKVTHNFRPCPSTSRVCQLLTTI